MRALVIALALLVGLALAACGGSTASPSKPVDDGCLQGGNVYQCSSELWTANMPFVREGMTRSDVRALVGEPEAATSGDGSEVWAYGSEWVLSFVGGKTEIAAVSVKGSEDCWSEDCDPTLTNEDEDPLR